LIPINYPAKTADLCCPVNRKTGCTAGIFMLQY